MSHTATATKLRVTVDGKIVTVPSGATVLDAAREAEVWIPTLCNVKGLSPYEACRICTVETTVNGRTRLQASCSLPAQDGMEVRTDTPRVVQGRKLLMELILSRAPHVEALRIMARRLGVEDTRFPEKDGNCILCGACVRACSDLMNVGAIGFAGRGVTRAVETPFGEATDTCRACGACTFVCPTGRMQMEAEHTDRFRAQSGWHRQCRYVRMGYFSYKVCHNHFECWHCEVDQNIESYVGTHAAFFVQPGTHDRMMEVSEFRLAPALHYHPGHAWVAPLNGKVRVGIDDFAAKLLAPLTDVVPPEMERTLEQGEPAFQIRSGDRAVTIRLPIQGTVVDVNPDVLIDPGLAAKAPYTRGWVATIRPENLRPDLTRLLHRGSASAWLHGERERLLGFLRNGDKEDPLSLAGAVEKLEDTQWERLLSDFF